MSEHPKRVVRCLKTLLIGLLSCLGGCLMLTESFAAQPAHIYFAGGCFWGVEEYFSRIPGVCDAVSGYANGTTDHPDYAAVSTGSTGHAETVHVTYDPSRVSLQTLARQFFRIIDPLSHNQQGNDRGSQYRTGIYYTNAADQKILAEIMACEQKNYAKPLAVELAPLKAFFPAEDDHQDYLRKHPNGYCHINFASLKDLPVSLDAARYRKPDQATLKKTQSPEAYAVTQEAATEPPFSGKYLHNATKGLYVDVVTGEPLFFSQHQFDSGSGWPSFSRPVDPVVVTERTDKSHGLVRREVRSRVGDSHLGHVFDDGPKELGGLRYCINSAALRFIPHDQMVNEDYGDLLPLLETE